MKVRRSALKHGDRDRFIDLDVHHAVEHALLSVQLSEDPDRYLVIGPKATDAMLLEVVVVVDEFDELVAIHAMKLSRQYHHLLREGEHDV